MHSLSGACLIHHDKVAFSCTACALDAFCILFSIEPPAALFVNCQPEHKLYTQVAMPLFCHTSPVGMLLAGCGLMSEVIWTHGKQTPALQL